MSNSTAEAPSSVEKALFASAIVFLLTAIVLTTSDSVGLDDRSAEWNLQVYAVAGLYVLYAAAFNRIYDVAAWYFVSYFAIAVVVLLAPVMMLHAAYWKREAPVAFWATLVLAVCSAVFRLRLNWSTPLTSMLTVFGVAWTVATTFVWFGLVVMDYAYTPIIRTRELSVALDLRYLSSAIFCVAWSVSAIAKTPRVRLQELATFPILQLRSVVGSSVVHVIAMPVVLTANVLLRLFCVVVDITWKLIATITIYSYRFGHELAKLFSDALLRKEVIKIIAKGMATTICALTSIALALGAGPLFVSYLRSSTWTTSTPLLLWIGAIVVSVCIVVMVTIRLLVLRAAGALLVDVLSPVANIAVAALIAGLVACLLSHIRRLEMRSLQLPGPFTTVFGGVAVMGLIAWLARSGVVVSERNSVSSAPATSITPPARRLQRSRLEKPDDPADA